jgi:signal transduction histidine kinase
MAKVRGTVHVIDGGRDVEGLHAKWGNKTREGRNVESFDAPRVLHTMGAVFQMNPLPRFVAIVLFMVLAALVALLAMPVWRGIGESDRGSRMDTGANAAPPAASRSNSARALVMSQRVALVLAATALALSVALILSHSLRAVRGWETRNPFRAIRTEVGALARLAQTSTAQGEELSRERDVRRRAEEDARLKQQLLTQSLDEKIRLGHDLHDGIIQSLYAAGLTLESVRALVKSNPDEADRQLEATRANLNEAIRDVRAYVVGLAPENLRRAGFAHGLSALLGELRAGREAEFDMKIDVEAAALLTPQQSIEALQIAREAVSNALRHGHATRITLRMHKGDGAVCLLVQDNGDGFNPARRRDGGHGLGNMQARAERIGASLRVTSTPGEGARVLATLPIVESAVV